MTCTVPSTKRRRRLDRRRRRHAARTRNFRDSPRPPAHVNEFPVAAAKIWNAPPDIVGRSSLTVASLQNSFSRFPSFANTYSGPRISLNYVHATIIIR